MSRRFGLYNNILSHIVIIDIYDFGLKALLFELYLCVLYGQVGVIVNLDLLRTVTDNNINYCTLFDGSAGRSFLIHYLVFLVLGRILSVYIEVKLRVLCLDIIKHHSDNIRHSHLIGAAAFGT